MTRLNSLSRARNMRRVFLALALGLTGIGASCDDDDDDGECKPAVGPLAVPFCEDIANVARDRYPFLHDSLVKLASSLPETRLNIDSVAEFQTFGEIDKHVFGQVVAFEGDTLLTEQMLADRPRIVAKIYTSEQYRHGLQSGWSYVIVGGQNVDGWRILLVSENVQDPVSVLYDWKHTRLGDPPDSANVSTATRRGMVHIHPRDSVGAWMESMSYPVRQCYKKRYGACLVNRRGGVPIVQVDANPGKRQSEDDTNFQFESTDQWIWITGAGCVCLGTQCHGAARK